MRRNVELALVFLIFIAFYSNRRVSAGEGGKWKPEGEKKKSNEEKKSNASEATISPSPSPLPMLKARNPARDPPKNDNQPSKSESVSKAKHGVGIPPFPSGSSSSVPEGSKPDNGREKDADNKGVKASDASVGSADQIQEFDNCKRPSIGCSGGDLSACLHIPKTGSQDLFLLLKNEGIGTLTVNIEALDTEINNKVLSLAEHHHEKINFTASPTKNLKILLRTGNGECLISYIASSEGPVSQMNLYQQLSSYTTHMTPIHGVYFLFLISLIVGGTWTCCTFVKRRRHADSGVAYQELEMGLPYTASAAAPNSWDEGWDDDWEDKTITKTSEIRHVGNVSANGLSSRTPKREGWDDDWDE